MSLEPPSCFTIPDCSYLYRRLVACSISGAFSVTSFLSSFLLYHSQSSTWWRLSAISAQSPAFIAPSDKMSCFRAVDGVCFICFVNLQRKIHPWTLKLRFGSLPVKQFLLIPSSFFFPRLSLGSGSSSFSPSPFSSFFPCNLLKLILECLMENGLGLVLRFDYKFDIGAANSSYAIGLYPVLRQTGYIPPRLTESLCF